MVVEGPRGDEEALAAFAPLVFVDSGVSTVVQSTTGGSELSPVAGLADVLVTLLIDDNQVRSPHRNVPVQVREQIEGRKRLKETDSRNDEMQKALMRVANT